ncbi:MAG: M56 family metallopeptidase [Akkermansiaceae bacterium]|jgi:beta-lactamase regulating signal transducer with metallopeptidase domain|nr:M56 family metallopeptidase [Akkermansiaceae bacterium]
MIATALLFSLFASGLVALAGRREPRLAAGAMLALLLIPMLQFLPKWEVLPLQGKDMTSTFPWGRLWLGVSALLTLRLPLAALTLHRWRRQGQVAGSIAVSKERNAEIILSPWVSGPMAAGIFRPVIFVPSCWPSWSEETRRIVLTHELAHLRRRDPLWLVLGQLACALHWFNPLVWWLARRQRIDAEFACDASVVESGIPAKRYASLLCDLAAGGTPPATAVAMAQESLLRGRVKHLFQPAHVCPPLATALLLGSLIAAAVALSIIGTRSPEVPVPIQEIQLRLSADPFPGN